MALGAMFLLEVIILFSFIVTTIFMFITKEEIVHSIFFALAIALGVFVTIIDATSIPTNLVPQIVIAWMGLIPSAIAVLIAIAKGKITKIAKFLVMLTSIFGALGYFFLV